MIRAVLFDAAGTLIELREPVGETYARVARRHGVAVSSTRLGEAFARAHRAAPPMAFPGADAAETARRERAWWRDVVTATFRAAAPTAHFRDYDAFFAALFASYAGPDLWRAREGAHAALAALRRRGLRLAVVSNFDRRLHAILAGLDLAGAFEAVLLPSDAGAAKPDPALFRLALARLGCAAHEAVYVGDDARDDIAGAASADLAAIDVADLATLRELEPRLFTRRNACTESA